MNPAAAHYYSRSVAHLTAYIIISNYRTGAHLTHYAYTAATTDKWNKSLRTAFDT